jgi:hypothetical protein
MIFVIPVFFAAWRKKITLNDLGEDIWIGLASFALVLLLGWKVFDWTFPAFFVVVAMLTGILIKRNSSGKLQQWFMALGILVVCSVFQWWTLHYLPVKDYRAYAIGQNLVENMKNAEDLGLEPPKFLTFYTLKKAGSEDVKEVDSDTYLNEQIWKDSTWVIQKELTYSKKVKDGYEPKIADFAALDFDGNDLKDSLMNIPRLYLVVTYDLRKTDTANMKFISEFANAAQADGAVVLGFTTAGYDDCENFRHEHQLAFPYIQGDEKVLKTMIRANPGVMYIERGTVVNMWSHNNLPSYIDSRR